MQWLGHSYSGRHVPFWGRVLEAFEMLYPDGYNRPINTQYMFWAISKEVNEFRHILALVESRRQSGWSDADVMQQARSQFQACNNNKAFQLENCYYVLKELPQFSSLSATMKTGFSQEDNDRICSPSALGAHKSNLSGSSINSKVPLERNPEREVEKEWLKKKVIRSDKISAILDEARARNACFMEQMKKKRSEIDKQLVELEREEREHEQWKWSMDRRLIHEHNMQKLESEQQKRESRMSMDLSTLTDFLHARYFKSRQEETSES